MGEELPHEDLVKNGEEALGWEPAFLVGEKVCVAEGGAGGGMQL